MISFILSFILLILGYVFYGKYVEKIFRPKSDRPTPAYTHRDGVDYLPMPTWKVFLIQFLNIAGTGPIFGAILGILYGPAAYLWIVFGCIFAGAVHDYFVGMISVKKGGISVPEIVGDEMGRVMRIFMRVLALVLLVLVGAVFARTPADLIAVLTPTDGFVGGPLFWLAIIIIYYICATLLPVDKLIGRLYPLFGAALLIMALGILYGIFVYSGSVPELTFNSLLSSPNPNGLSVFPCVFVTIACGAVSGFHATQSPLMARCINNEKNGRKVFYGSMIMEGLLALIWAVGSIKFADTLNIAGNTPYEKLSNILTDCGSHSANPALLVNAICSSWLGVVGSVLAILGVVAAPITSGDTAFRSARLIISDFLKLNQKKIFNRLIIALPIFVLAIVLFFIDFQVLWRYFAWTNQTLATIVLWTITVALARRHKQFFISLVPAIFMTDIITVYICYAPEGFGLPLSTSRSIGSLVIIGSILLFIWWIRTFHHKLQTKGKINSKKQK